MRCPTCKKAVRDTQAWRPFCSERCKLLDLGCWLDGRYRVAGEAAAAQEAYPVESDLEEVEDTERTPGRRVRSRLLH